jgi:ATP-dependent Clp protease ATP-binding subunit ClpC
VPEDLSAASQRVFEIAGHEAIGLNHDFTGTEHILLGLILCEDEIVAPLLAKHGMAADEVRARVAGASRLGAAESPHVRSLTARARQVLTLAASEADVLGDHELEPQHLLLGILRQETGVAALVLRDKGVDLADLREEIVLACEVLAPPPVGRSEAVVAVGASSREMADAAGESGPDAEVVAPICPSCGKPLAEVLAATSITPIGAAAAGRRHAVPAVSIVYCGACGHTLSAVR